jgi:hypothetical protein
MVKKILGYFIIVGALLVGLLSLYRSFLKPSNMIVIKGKVIDKKISYFTSYGSGRHYSLIFKIEGRSDKIAINLGTKREAEKDSTIYLIDTLKTYEFFVDPTVPIRNKVKTGITRIEYNGQIIYQTYNNLNFYGGLFISLLSLAGLIIIIYKAKQKKASNKRFGVMAA